MCKNTGDEDSTDRVCRSVDVQTWTTDLPQTTTHCDRTKISIKTTIIYIYIYIFV